VFDDPADDGSAGVVTAIVLRPARREPAIVVDAALAIAGRGLEGDRASQRAHRTRQITLIDAAVIERVGRQLGLGTIGPAILRRNVVVRGLDLDTARGRGLRVGDALLEVTGPCDPCARMEEVLGEGGWDALRDAGGLTAVVREAGRIVTGDGVRVVDMPRPQGVA
jgi:MOSC domain-containing protein YiiM